MQLLDYLHIKLFSITLNWSYFELKKILIDVSYSVYVDGANRFKHLLKENYKMFFIIYSIHLVA